MLIFFLTLPVLAGLWCLLAFQFSLGVIKLDRRARTIKRGGRRALPVGRAVAVHITWMPHILGLLHVVSLVWDGGDRTARWHKALTSTPTNVCFLFSFRKEAGAERAAGVIADFLSVPIQRRTSWKPVSP